jgi:uncharacterized repeat protein (TIGR03806 family)
MRRGLLLVAFVLATVSCDEGAQRRTIDEWGLFVDPRTQSPAPGVVPYAIVAPLFSDHASKHRFIRLPEGESIRVAADGTWEFPVGTVLVKTFGMPRDLRDPGAGERILETRLLVREAEGWRALVYVWDDAVSEAVLTPAGRRIRVETVGFDGAPLAFDYRVPSHTLCANCHGGDEPLHPLGPRTAQMDLDGQLERFAAMGMIPASPPRGAEIVDPFTADPAVPLEARARSYLHAQCGHCHRPDGDADQSGLFLHIEERSPEGLGICKLPVAAGRASGGRRVVIDPGNPDGSILIYRVESTEAGVKMPELGSSLVDVRGAALLRRWIAEMPPRDCGI